MNIEQIQSDLANGVIVSPGTWRKLVEAAQMMETELRLISKIDHENEVGVAYAEEAIRRLEAL